MQSTANEAIEILFRMVNQMPVGSYKYSFMWFCFCCFLHLAFGFGTVEILPQVQKIMTLYDRQDWYNRGVSIIHAFIMFVRAITYWFLLNPAMKLTLPLDNFGVITLDIMMGYLWYDLLIEAAKSKKQYSTLLHHLLGYFSLYSVRASHSKLGIFYFMLVFVAEGSTPLLHMLWFLSKLRLKDSLVFKSLGTLLFIVFFALRIIMGPYTLWHLVAKRAAWDSRAEPEGYWLFPSLVVVACSFVLINFYWFALLLRMAAKAGKETPTAASDGAASEKKKT